MLSCGHNQHLHFRITARVLASYFTTVLQARQLQQTLGRLVAMLALRGQSCAVTSSEAADGIPPSERHVQERDSEYRGARYWEYERPRSLCSCTPDSQTNIPAAEQTHDEAQRITSSASHAVRRRSSALPRA